MALPQRIDMGMPRNWSLDTLWHNRELHLRNPDETRMHAPGQRWVMGYAIPPFQRGLVWDDLDRKIRFVESLHLGLPAGSFMYNAVEESVVRNGRSAFHETDRWLIDGQQRLSALDGYFGNEFPVYGLYWDDLDVVQRRRFLRTPFPAYETSITDIHVLREIYDRLNFGGVAHTQDQRATSDDEQIVPTGLRG